MYTSYPICYCPLSSGICPLWKYPVTGIRNFTSAARTPVTNHVFHCTLSFSLIMSECPKYTPAPPPLGYFVLRKWLLFMLYFAVVSTKLHAMEGRNIRLLAICNYNLPWSKEKCFWLQVITSTFAWISLNHFRTLSVAQWWRLIYFGWYWVAQFTYQISQSVKSVLAHGG